MVIFFKTPQSLCATLSGPPSLRSPIASYSGAIAPKKGSSSFFAYFLYIQFLYSLREVLFFSSKSANFSYYYLSRGLVVVNPPFTTTNRFAVP